MSIENDGDWMLFHQIGQDRQNRLLFELDPILNERVGYQSAPRCSGMIHGLRRGVLDRGAGRMFASTRHPSEVFARI